MSIAQPSSYVPLRGWALDLTHVFILYLALICITSSALAIAQAFGWNPVHEANIARPSGLLFNPVHQSETLALMAVALVTYRYYWLALTLLPGIYLTDTRSGWAILAVGLFATYFRQPLWYLVATLAFGLLWILHPSPTDLMRLAIWHAAWVNLTFWGNGFGSFMYLYIGNSAHMLHPEYAHNDYLQTVFEFGVFALIPFSIIAWGVTCTSARAWPILIAFLFAATFSMPVHMPIAAVLGAIALASTLLETAHA